MSDSAGNWPKWIEDGWEKIVEGANWINDNIIQPTVEFVSDVAEDIRNFDINNTSEETVFDANYFSCYKGAFVVKTSLDTSFSYGIIGLSRSQQDVNTLRHEYGHVLQMQRKGVVGYTFGVMIPVWL